MASGIVYAFDSEVNIGEWTPQQVGGGSVARNQAAQSPFTRGNYGWRISTGGGNVAYLSKANIMKRALAEGESAFFGMFMRCDVAGWTGNLHWFRLMNGASIVARLIAVGGGSIGTGEIGLYKDDGLHTDTYPQMPIKNNGMYRWIEVEFARSVAGQNNGLIRVWRDGTLVCQQTGVDNDTRANGPLELQVASPVTGVTWLTLDVDDFRCGWSRITRPDCNNPAMPQDYAAMR